MSDFLYGFRNVSQYGQTLVTDQFESNLYSWLQWGMLGIGGFTNVNSPAKLRPVIDERTPAVAGKTNFFEGNRADWVWQSGVPYSTQPLPMSGIYVSGSFVPSSSTGVYQHTVLYPEGKIRFTNPQPTGLPVSGCYSYRNTTVRRADEQWFQTLLLRSYRTDEDFAKPPTSGGSWSILSQNRVQLPAMVIEPINHVRLVPHEVGSRICNYYQDFFVHCVAETPYDRRQLHDILVAQHDIDLPTFDKSKITYPLDYAGALQSGALTHPQLCQTYPGTEMRVTNLASTQNANIGDKIYWCSVKLTLHTYA